MGLSFPETYGEVMQARRDAGFTTPIEPVGVNELWCVFEQRGTYEFMVHPWAARFYLENGMYVDGKRLAATKIDEYPMLGAIQILVVDDAQNQAFTR